MKSCQHCPNSGTVHTRCEGYHARKAERERQNKVIRQEKENGAYHFDAIMRRADVSRKLHYGMGM